MSSEIKVRRAGKGDVPAIAKTNASVFLGDRDRLDGASEWVNCWFNSFPLYQYFIVIVDEIFAGYAGWQIHGGFHRAEPVIELDQIGIDPKYQGQRLATILMRESMRELVDWVKKKDDRIESHVTFVVWAYSLNFNAISAYAKDFTDGMYGFRTQFGNRSESMFRVRIPVIRPVRDS